MKLDELKLDANLMEDGAWFEYGGGLRFKIARVGNKLTQERFQKNTGLMALASRRRGGSTEKDDAAWRKIAADTIVRDWEGLEDSKGKVLKFTPKRCLDIFEDPETRHILGWVLDCAQEEEGYRKEIAEEALGN